MTAHLAEPAVVAARDSLRAERRRALLKMLGDALLGAVITFATVIVLWWVLLQLVDVSDFTAKGPSDVWKYLFTTEAAS